MGQASGILARYEPKGATMLMPVHRRSLFVTLVFLSDLWELGQIGQVAKEEISP
jgi:hypothetical protein